eukprot:snap_masked-scaffold_26-processed-gene-4.120-mRNA-1 protein AED:1.00 eAED:1.00 QI:0/-1/0/0/-1/1/1/0/72
MYGHDIAIAGFCTDDNKYGEGKRCKCPEFYAPVSPISTICIFLTVAIQFDTWLRQFDTTMDLFMVRCRTLFI